MTPVIAFAVLIFGDK